MDELEWEIARVDPKKTIQMGSFRINPDGSQSVVEVTYYPSNKVAHPGLEYELGQGREESRKSFDL